MFTPPPSPSPVHPNNSFREHQRTPVPLEEAANESYDPHSTNSQPVSQGRPPTLLSPPPFTAVKVASKSTSQSPSPPPPVPHALHTSSKELPTMTEPYHAQLSRKKAVGRRIKLVAVLLPVSLILLAFACSHSICRLPLVADLLRRHYHHPSSVDDLSSSPPELLDVDVSSGVQVESSESVGIHNVNRWINHHWSERIHSRHQKRQGLPVNPSASGTSSGSGSVAPTPTSTGTPTIPDPASPPALPTPFPQPFDSSLGFSWSTRSCQVFFETFTRNITFRECRPFGLLLATSTAFFHQAQDNLTALNAVIWGTCNTDPTVETCVNIMDWHANQIQALCAQDLRDGNEFADQALTGFLSYRPFREAGCLPNLRTNSYCYVEAVTAPDPADLYYYALPLGTGVSNRTTPSCSACVKSVLNIYSQYASNSSLPLSDTYDDAARRAINQCGETYAVAGQSDTNSSVSLRLPFAALVWMFSFVVAGLFGFGMIDYQ